MTSGTLETGPSRLRGLLAAYAVPAVIGALVLLLEVGGEPVRLALRYERTALAAGEIWRLLSAHLVHLGPSHALMNTAALAVLALLLARSLRRLDWIGASLTAALVIDAGLYWLDPSVAWYVGLSGVLHGIWAAACVSAWIHRRPEALPLTALIVIKLGWEIATGPLPLTGAVAGGAVIEIAHLYGAIGGVLWSSSMIAVRRGLGLPL